MTAKILLEQSWAAGFFDGEGCVFLHRQKDRKARSVRLDIAQTDRRVLDRFLSAVGHGKVYGPYPGSNKGKNNQDYWRYTCCAKEHVNDVLNQLWPFLSEQKKVRALEVYNDC